MQRVARSFRLLRASLKVLRQDKERVLLPAMGGILSLPLAALCVSLLGGGALREAFGT